MIRAMLRSFASFFAAVAAVMCMAAASDPAERLSDPAQEARARAIFRDVRCLVCQNESIDDSSAELAADLRRIVREQVAAGRSDAEVRTFLTERYGEFVLLKPSFSAGNAALWIGPFVIVGFGLLLLVTQLRRRAPEAELSDEEADRLKGLTRDQGP
ncbi:MAG: cytochrome c-type biogenesis protein CcmH [Phenylobacterium sp.]|uniref:cytochrome c-type biogenesis protein n=1 Tax=Phenylobacterium sp. TaxID=1871053 RepID=UPI003919CF0F